MLSESERYWDATNGLLGVKNNINLHCEYNNVKFQATKVISSLLQKSVFVLVK